jgi:LacI family transcriptional regulator
MQENNVDMTAAPKAVTLKDIALRCGFSKGTVSRALLRDSRISAATTEAILAVATELGYDPSRNIAARRMVLSQHQRNVQNRAVAFYTTITDSRYQANLLTGIWTGLAAEDHVLVLVHSHNPVTHERTPLPHVFKSGDVDGAILHETEYWVNTMIAEMRREPNYGQRPIVNTRYPMSGASTVLPDYYAGALASAGHLFDLGHRHLLHFYPPQGENSHHARERMRGYHDACRQHGLNPDRHLHAHLNPHAQDWTHNLGVSELLAFLHAHPHITAILARHDLEAIKLIRGLSAAGIGVPEQISIVGFDDTDSYVGSGNANILTSVRLPVFEIGKQAAHLIVQQVAEHAVTEEHRIVPVEFIVRGTTAPPPPGRATR